MDYLVFESEQEAQTGLEAIYCNMVGSVDSSDLLDVSSGVVVDKNALTPDQAVQVNAGNRHFPVFGKNAQTGAKDIQAGYTTAWAEAQQTVQGKWVFEKPKDDLMDGVVGYAVEPYNPSWFPQAAE